MNIDKLLIEEKTQKLFELCNMLFDDVKITGSFCEISVKNSITIELFAHYSCDIIVFPDEYKIVFNTLTYNGYIPEYHHTTFTLSTFKDVVKVLRTLKFN